MLASNSSHNYVYMGTIGKPHGIRGELTVYTPAKDPTILQGRIFLYLPDKTNPGLSPGFASDPSPDLSKDKLSPAEITSLRMHKGSPLIMIDGIKDRTAAEKFRHYKLYINREKLPPVETNEFYITDLLGFEIYTREDRDDEVQYLGILSSAAAPAGQELWTITSENGDEILFPAVEEFLEGIDMDEEIIVINPPPGLLELNLKTNK